MADRKESNRSGPAMPAIRLNATAKAAIAVFALPLAGVLFPTCLVMGVCMAPTAVSFLLDRDREKYLVLSTAMLNFCGTLPTVAELWARGQTMGGVAESLADPLAWVMAYGAAGLGWLLHLAMPPIVSAYYARSTEARIRQLTIEQQALVEAWGEDVKRDPGDSAAASDRPSGDGTPASPPPFDAAKVLGI